VGPALTAALTCRVRNALFPVACWLLLQAAVGTAQPASEAPALPTPSAVITREANGRATVRAVRVERLEFDGRLDDEVYARVPAFGGFIQSQPDEGKPSSERTDAWIFFDDDAIYFSARCWETRPPEAWIANEMRRDRTGSNDSFGVLIDTFADQRNGFMFYANPLGGFADVQVTNIANRNFNWNPIWDVRTGRFDGGWTIEMRMPFKSLRYKPGREQIWGFQLRRNIRGRNELAWLTPLPASDGPAAWTRLSLAATLVGLEAPPGSRNLDIKPYAITRLSTDQATTPVILNDVMADAGLDVKYGVTQNLTLDLTVNTDFAQVEVDEQQINLTRFNLLFPEKRDFFLESGGLFQFARSGAAGSGGVTTGGGYTPELFFSRQIGLQNGRVVPVIGGARLTGKVRALNVGLLNMQTDAEPVSGIDRANFTVLRLKQDVLRGSSLGMMLTHRSVSLKAPGESNQAFGVDGTLALYRDVYFNGYYARTRTPGREDRTASYQGRFDYTADRYGLKVDYLYVGDGFNPEVGFIRRPGMRRTGALARFSPRPVSLGSVRKFTWEGEAEHITNMTGRLDTRRYEARFNTEFQRSDRFRLSAESNYEYVARAFRVASITPVEVGGYDFNRINASYSFGTQRRLAGTVSASVGGFYGGDQTSLGFSGGRLEVTPYLSMEPSASVNWFDLPAGSLTTQLYRVRATYTFTPRMFAGALVQYNSSSRTVSVNARMRWEYRPGSELFVVYTEDRDTDSFMPGPSNLLSRGIVVKVNRLVRF
jgi:hypothetical protein